MHFQGLVTVAAMLLLIGGCQCSDNDTSGQDTSATDSDADADTDADSDADSDSDTVDEQCPGQEVDVVLDPTLEWEPIPEGMECGVGCQQLTSTGGAQEFDVFDNRLVVAENGANHRIITLVDIAASTTALVEVGYQTIDASVGHPSVFEGTYFYKIREDPAKEHNYVWGTPEAKGYKLLEPCTGAVYELDAWGAFLAYAYRMSGQPAGSQKLYLLNRETLERKQVTDFGGVGEITISGDWATFMRIGGNVEIYAYNVVTEELTNISDHPSDQFNSRNDGTHVVWTDLRSNPEADYYDHYSYGAADIYYYNIETQELLQITSGNGIQLYPDIHGDWIVWQDFRECEDPDYPYQGCKRIWGYNLNTEEMRKLTSIGGEYARVWGDKVYFRARYQEDPIQGAVFVQDLNQLPDADAGPDGGK